MDCQVCVIRGLLQQSIDVLIGAPLPAAGRFTRVDGRVQSPKDGRISSHFRDTVSGQAELQVFSSGSQNLHDLGGDLVGGLGVRWMS